MAYYLQLVVLTDKGRRNFEDDPEWIKEVNEHVELMGAKIITQYALLGQYDFINILEAKDNKTIARVAIQLGSRGTLQTMTMAAMTVDEFIASI